MTKPPVTQQPGRKEQVRQMFDSIAGNYDFLNHFLSLGIDRSWRRKLIKKMAEQKPAKVLDLATGTADLAIMAASIDPEMINGTDITEGMLEIGRKKVAGKGLQNKIQLLLADSENLPFDDNSFDAATVAFGVRNYENLPKGLNEMIRVLKPGGKAYILEFSKPKTTPFRQLFNFYFQDILPLFGKLVSKHNSAYKYLPESVYKFPEGNEFLSIMKQSGFVNCTDTRFTLGVCSFYTAEKK
jgi:demethylmenaquinone methyltransferase / 2-methoxy-6-polyprenyl-1,4-benzoquinol methylase